MDRATDSQTDIKLLLKSIRVPRIDSGQGWHDNLEELRRLITTTAEGPLFDRKLEMPVIHCTQKDIANADDELCAHIQEFVADMLSFLNAARRIGKPAYMVFGVANKWKKGENWGIVENGILEKSTRNMDLEEYSEYLETEERFQELHRKLIEKEDFRGRTTLIHENPSDVISYEFGWFEKDNGESVLLSYLRFAPQNVTNAFAVKNVGKKHKVWLKKLNLAAGETWTRHGEDKAHYAPEETHLLASWQDVPFITISSWKEYIKRFQGRIRGIRTGHIPDRLKEVGLQTLSVYSSNTKRVENLRTVFEEFLQAPSSSSQVLFIQGYGGMGKSTAVQLFTEELAERLRSNLETVSEYKQPEAVIPLYVKLSGFRESMDTPENYVTKTLDGLEYDRYEQFSKIFTDRNLQFLIVLDAVDEMALDERERSIDAISQMFQSFPHPKFIVASRPNIFSQTQIEKFHHCELWPLQLNQILDRIKAEGYEESVEQQLSQHIENNPNIQNLLQIPRMLDECIRRFADDSQISLGKITEAVIEGYLEREVEKLSSLAEGRELRVQLYNVASQINNDKGMPITDTTKILSSEFYNLLLQSGVLRLRERKIYFSSGTIADYLLARQILDDKNFRIEYQETMLTQREQHMTLIHIVANLAEFDVSDEEGFIVEWISSIRDPAFAIQIFLERLNPDFTNIDLLRQFFTQFVEQNRDIGTIQSLIIRALSDVNLDIFSAAINLLANNSELSLSISTQLEKLFILEEDSFRQTLLWKTLLDAQKLSTPEMLVQLVSEVDTNVDLILGVIEQLDWSGEIPQVLLEQRMFERGTDNAIREKILLNMIEYNTRISDVAENVLEEMTYESDYSIRASAERLLGQTPEAVIESENKDSTDEFMSSNLDRLLTDGYTGETTHE